jgi:hypothetical protein
MSHKNDKRKTDQVPGNEILKYSTTDRKEYRLYGSEPKIYID